jgi:hypothetical protein
MKRARESLTFLILELSLYETEALIVNSRLLARQTWKERESLPQ